MGSKLGISRWLVFFIALATLGIVGCSNGDGPNDPGMTSAQIQKVRASAVKPSDGAGPGAAKQADPTHPNKR